MVRSAVLLMFLSMFLFGVLVSSAEPSAGHSAGVSLIQSQAANANLLHKVQAHDSDAEELTDTAAHNAEKVVQRHHEATEAYNEEASGEPVKRFIALDGKDDNDGSENSPFASVKACYQKSKEGDICFLRKGTYGAKQVQMELEDKSAWNPKKGFSKIEKSPITIAAYPGEKVRFSGVQRIDGGWKKIETPKWIKTKDSCIYETKVDKPVWQLFVGDEMQTSARWPNAHWKDMSVFDEKKVYAYGDFNKWKCGKTVGIGSLAKYTSETGVDVSGAIGVMNIGSWISYAMKVQQTSPDTLKYQCPPKIVKQDSTRFFLEGKTEFVDSPTEWAYDPKSGVVLFWPEDCKDPNNLKVYGKTDSFFLTGRASYLTYKNIEFFGLTFSLSRSISLTIEACEFTYPVYSRRMLGETGADSTVWKISRGLRFINNTVAYSDGQFINHHGSSDSTFENNHFHHMDYSCIGYESGVNYVGVVNLNDKDVFRHNTCHDIGTSDMVKSQKGSLVEYNLLHDHYKLQHDGSVIQMTGASDPSGTTRFNWVYNSGKRCYRLDRANEKTAPYNKRGKVHGNLAWNTSAAYFKGDHHNITNNVIWHVNPNKRTGKPMEITIWVLGPGQTKYAYDFENTHSVVNNNGGEGIGSGTSNHTLAGPNQDNIEVTDVPAQFQDPSNFDFRSKSGSEFAHAHVGPYSVDGSDYWIPGRREHGASFPVPGDGASHVPREPKLFFRPGFKAQGHKVLLGVVEGKLRPVKDSKSTGGSWLATPKKLARGKKYLWQVVTQYADHEVHGPIWTFTVEPRKSRRR